MEGHLGHCVAPCSGVNRTVVCIDMSRDQGLTQTPKRGRLAGGVVSGDTDALPSPWALFSGVPAAASCRCSAHAPLLSP